MVGSGIGKREVEIQLALAQAFFNQPLEEKTALECDFPNGNYFGYKRLNRRPVFGTAVLENSEFINIPKFAIVLELENENYFVERHLYDDPSDDHLRYMKYTLGPWRMINWLRIFGPVLTQTLAA